MNVENDELVLARGINSDWINENFTGFWVGFGADGNSIPKEDAYYVALYIGVPESRIMYLGIVGDVIRYEDHVEYYLKALIKLKNPIDPGHPIRKHEYWSLSQLGIPKVQVEQVRKIIMNSL